MPDNIIINPTVNQITVTEQVNSVIIRSPGPQGPAGVMIISQIPTISPIINTGSSIAFDQIAQYITLDARYAKITGSVQFSASSGSALYATNAGSATYSSSAGYATNSGSSVYSDTSASTLQTNFTTLSIAGSAVATQSYVNNASVLFAVLSSSAQYSSSAGYANLAGTSASLNGSPASSYALNTYVDSASLNAYNAASAFTLAQGYQTSTGSVSYAASAGTATTATTAASATYAASAGTATTATTATYAASAGTAINSNTTSQTNFNPLTISGSAVATQDYVNSQDFQKSTGSVAFATNSGSSSYATNSGNSLTTSQTSFNNINITASTQSTNTANGALIVAGGIGTGDSVNIGGNLNVTGNIFMSGSAFTIGASNLEVIDSIILLSASNYYSDLLDIGFYGAYGSTGHDSASNHYHTGLVRDHLDDKWKLFSSGSETSPNTIDFNTATYDTLKLGAIEVSSSAQVNNLNSQYLAGIGSASYARLDQANVFTVGGHTITNESVGVIPLVINGVASQTADTLRINTATGQKFYFGNTLDVLSTGRLELTNTSNVTNDNLGRLAVRTFASQIGVVVRGAASQTANLQEWQNASATILTRVSSDGTISAPALSISGNAVFNYQSTFQNSAVIPLIAKNLGGTANIQEWQNSIGTPLARLEYTGKFVSNSMITSLGSIHSYNLITSGTSETQYSSATLSLNTRAAGNIGAVIRGSASQTANLQEWQSSDSTILARVNNFGEIVTSTTVYANGIQNNTSYWSFTNNGVGQITARNATNIPLTLKGSASQTANLQEWQDSSGSVLAGVTASGRIYTGSAGPVTNLAGTAQGQLSAVSSASNIIPLIVRRPSAGNANTFEVQQSGGQPYVWVDQNMVLYSTAAFNAQPSTVDGTAINAYPTSGNHRGDLLKITNSSQTITRAAFNAIGQIYTGSPQPILTTVSTISSINTSGVFASVTTTTSSNNLSVGQIVYITGASPNEYNGNFYVNTVISSSSFLVSKSSAFVTASAVTPGTLSLPPQLSIVTASANVSGISIQGKAGQQGNLLEFRNSSGTVVSNIIGNGDWVVPALYNTYNGVGTGYSIYFGGITSLFVVPTGQTKVGGIFRQRNSLSTGDLTQWQTSNASGDYANGTAVAGVTASGQIYTGASAVVNTTYGTPQIPQVFITAPSANVGLYLKSQSSSQKMFAVENQVGTRRFDVSADGTVFLDGTFYVGYGSNFGPFGTGNGFKLSAQTNATVPLSVVNSGSAVTVDLMQLKSGSAQNTVMGVTASGFIYTGSAGPVFAAPAYGDSAAQLGVSYSASTPGLILKPSNFADGSTNSFEIYSSSIATSPSTFFNKFGQATLAALSVIGPLGSNSSNNNAFLRALASTAASSALILGRASVGQTADMLQLQNNSTSALFAVTAAGRLIINIPNGTQFSTASAMIDVKTSSSIIPGVIIRASASQTANLQEWQTASGAILASISGGGSLTVNGNVSGLNLRVNGGDTAGGLGILALTNATTLPTANPITGGIIYVESGALKYRGSSGAINTIAPDAANGTILQSATIDGGSA